MISMTQLDKGFFGFQYYGTFVYDILLEIKSKQIVILFTEAKVGMEETGKAAFTEWLFQKAVISIYKVGAILVEDSMQAAFHRMQRQKKNNA